MVTTAQMVTSRSRRKKIRSATTKISPEDDDTAGDEFRTPIEVSKSIAQIVSIKATPSWKWVGTTPGFYRCHGDTIVKVKLSDGTEQEHNYRDKTVILVTEGLIHFAPDNGPV